MNSQFVVEIDSQQDNTPPTAPMAYFNTTGTVNGNLEGYGYQKFGTSVGGVVAPAYDWSLFLNTGRATF